MPKSKFFVVAVEGGTCDGRTIEAKHLTEMAKNYDPATYAARVNLEHLRGFDPEGPFKSYGDVLALKTETVPITLAGKTEQKLALLAQIDPLPELIALNKKKQKLFTSIEINPSFSTSGEAYLQGVAVTDSPASLGTEMLQFCAGLGDKSPLAARKHSPDNVFSESIAFSLEIEDEILSPSAQDSFFARAGEFLAKFTGAKTPPQTEVVSEQPEPSSNSADLTQLAVLVGGMAEMIQTFAKDHTAALAKLTQRVDDLSAESETRENPLHLTRPPATGGGTTITTDC